MTHTKTKFIAAAVLACLAAVNTAGAASVTLESLLAGGTLTTGDKTISDFTYTASGDMPAAADINVLTVEDADGNYGIRFQGGFLDNSDGAISDALIGFTVTVDDPNMEIIGAILWGNPSVVGDGVAQITETFLPGVTDTKLDIYDISAGGFLGLDSVTFAEGHTSLNIQKDIQLNATGQGSIAVLSFVDQYFVQQQVPEPAAAGLFAFGFIGLLAKRRRRS